MSAQATAQNDSGEIQHHGRPNEDNVCLCVPEYAKHNQHQRKYNKFVLDFCQLAFSKEPDPSQQFLDVGCGTGDFTRDVLLPQCLPCGRIVGVDCNREMIEYARRNSAHEKLDFAVLDIGADVTEFLEEFGQFERVYSFFCLNWVDDMTAAFKNINRLLPPTGECLLVICAALQAPEAWKALAKIEGWAKYSETLLKFILKTQDMNDKKDMMRFVARILREAELFPTIMEALSSTLWDGWGEDDIIAEYKAICPIAHLITDEEKRALDIVIKDQVRKLHAPGAGRGHYRMFVVKDQRLLTEGYEASTKLRRLKVSLIDLYPRRKRSERNRK